MQSRTKKMQNILELGVTSPELSFGKISLFCVRKLDWR